MHLRVKVNLLAFQNHYFVVRLHKGAWALLEVTDGIYSLICLVGMV